MEYVLLSASLVTFAFGCIYIHRQKLSCYLCIKRVHDGKSRDFCQPNDMEHNPSRHFVGLLNSTRVKIHISHLFRLSLCRRISGGFANMALSLKYAYDHRLPTNRYQIIIHRHGYGCMLTNTLKWYDCFPSPRFSIVYLIHPLPPKRLKWQICTLLFHLRVSFPTSSPVPKKLTRGGNGAGVG